MGCISSKQGVSVTPAFDYSGGGFRDNGGSSGVLGSWHQHRAEDEGEKMKKKNRADSCGGGDSRRTKSSKVGESLSWRLGKYVQGEQVAAGWPAWLSAVGAEAIQGWIPLRADSFEKLDKIGQGTYSSVFRARDLDSGNIVALKKVRFDNFEPESVRFMTREIMILRRLEHPNIIKLLGLITSRLSCSIYLVFEYMEHDLAGLSTCPDIKFSESQIKCYMQQLLSGLEHCHSRGIMHRDIKGSNLLVNNEGILKIADFGLANFFSSGNRQPLTSRVVTLWYRPPELLLGSTSYGPSVDLWSVGCVFAELYLGKPILQGRTEVEQLHKIFKLCGSPPDEYWKKSRLPHATIFKPQHPYERALPDVCKEFPSNAVQLIENFLSVEPYKRETASSALASEYFTTKPYACDPSTLPKYPPNKEIDAKFREEARRKKNGGRARGNEATRRPSKTSKPFRESNGLAKSASMVKEFPSNTQHSQKTNGDNTHLHKDIGARPYAELSKPPLDTKQEVSHKQSTSTEEECFSGPLHVSASSGFAWVKKRESGSFTSQSRSSSRGKVCIAIDPSDLQLTRNTSESQGYKNVEALYQTQTYSQDQDSCESTKHAIRKKWRQVDRPDSFDSSSMYHSHELPAEFYQNEHSDNGYNTGYQNQGDLVKFSGPLLSQSNSVDELLERHERHIRQAVRRSWMQRAKSQGR